MDRPGVSRSKTTGYAAGSYSRPVRPTAGDGRPPLNSKPLPSDPRVTVQRSATTTGPLKAGSAHTNVRYVSKPQPEIPRPQPATLRDKPQPTVPRAPTKPLTSAVRPPPTSTKPLPTPYRPAAATVKRSNTTPIRLNTAPAISKPPVAAAGTTARRFEAPTNPTYNGIAKVPAKDPLAAVKAAALSRSKSESQRPGQTYGSRKEVMDALKAPLPKITQGAIANNLILAQENNMRVLDSGLPDVTSNFVVRIAESDGKCLKEAERALFGRHAPPAERIVWNRTADRDPGMKNLLEWVDRVRWGLASLGLHKFLDTKTRGALVFNVKGRLSNSPDTPAVDWITFEDAQRTLDQQLQNYIQTYDPSTHVLVFTFRVNPDGNSLHMWGKKLALPQSLPTTYEKEIADTKKKIDKRKLEVIEQDKAPKRSLSFSKWLKTNKNDRDEN